MTIKSSTRSGVWLWVFSVGCVADATELSLDVANRDVVTIHGTGRVTGVTDHGFVHGPMDLSGIEFATFTNVHGELARNDGAGTADGTFTVTVPRGAHSWQLLAADAVAPIVAVGDARHPTLDRNVLGRLDGVLATHETDVTFDVTGLEPWVPGSTTEITIGNNGGVIFSPEGAGPDTGATTLASTFDWATAQLPSPLVDAAKGDRVVLTQLALRTIGTESYQAVATAGTAEGYTQTDGVPSTLSVAMAPVPQKTLPLRWRGDRFEALTAEVGAAAFTRGGGAFLDTLPDADRLGFYGAGAPDLAVYFPTDVTADMTLALAYGNPYRSHGKRWDEFMTTVYFYTVPVQLGAATPVNVAASYRSNRSLRQLDGVLEPRIAPPRNVRFTGDELCWDAPSFGRPTLYLVTLETLSVTDGNTRANLAMRFWTSDRSLRIADDFVPPGTSFVAVVSAVDYGDVDRTTDLNGDSMPFEQASAVSQPFTR